MTLNKTAFTCADRGANQVTLTVQDAAGNSHTATATVTVQDNIDPTITAPANVSVNVDAGLLLNNILRFYLDTCMKG